MDKKLFQDFMTQILDVDTKQYNELKDKTNMMKDLFVQRLKYELMVGDRVNVSGGKRVTNENGTVIKINRTRAQVKLDKDMRTWNVPLVFISKI
jgi:hypothetical protein